jgi:hypothetical protein
LQEKINKDYKIKNKLSRELMDMRKKVHTLMSLKNYAEAEDLQNICNEKEMAERGEIEFDKDGYM